MIPRTGTRCYSSAEIQFEAADPRGFPSRYHLLGTFTGLLLLSRVQPGRSIPHGDYPKWFRVALTLAGITARSLFTPFKVNSELKVHPHWGKANSKARHFFHVWYCSVLNVLLKFTVDSSPLVHPYLSEIDGAFGWILKCMMQFIFTSTNTKVSVRNCLLWRFYPVWTACCVWFSSLGC